MTFERAEELLEEAALEIPEVYYQELNGGICLKRECRLSPHALEADLYICGEYRHNHYLGRLIQIYYGSILRVYGELSDTEMKKRLKHILEHELTHHLESLAGERDLEIQDQQELMEYRLKKQQNEA